MRLWVLLCLFFVSQSIFEQSEGGEGFHTFKCCIERTAMGEPPEELLLNLPSGWGTGGSVMVLTGPN